MNEKLQGIGVSPGIAIAKAVLFHTEEVFHLQKRIIHPNQISQEIALFEDALTKTRAQILEIRKKIAGEIGRDSSDIFNAHLLILEDRTMIEDVIKLIKDDHVGCECAFAEVIGRYFKAFSQINDSYLKERISDIRDVGKRLLKNLAGHDVSLDQTEDDRIIFAHDLSPSDTAALDKEKVLAFVTEIGGPTSHTAILGRSMEIPAVVGVAQVLTRVSNGDLVIVDGAAGLILVNPDEATIQEYRNKAEHLTQVTSELDKLQNLPAETTDGHKITLAANIEFHDELPSVLAHGANGIGLYRTEYLYLNRMDLPTEEEQYRAYCHVAESLAPFPVIIRTLDLGGDKFLSSLDLPREMNPFLGWRAIRFCLAQVDVFKVQLRAILRASAHGKLKVMYPMIANVQELRRANQILRECMEELKKEGKPFEENIEIGAMIEIPSAAVISDILAKEVNFFSIGTNDLIQYALAVDRVNEKIAYLYEPTHPAILMLIKHVVESAHRNQRWVGSCGEMSGDPAIAILLVGLGVDEISTSPVVLPKVKKAIRSVSFADAQAIAVKALTFTTGEEIREYLNEQLKRVAPDLAEFN